MAEFNDLFCVKRGTRIGEFLPASRQGSKITTLLLWPTFSDESKTFALGCTLGNVDILLPDVVKDCRSVEQTHGLAQLPLLAELNRCIDRVVRYAIVDPVIGLQQAMPGYLTGWSAFP